MTFVPPRIGQPLTVKVGIAFGYNLQTYNGTVTDVTQYVRGGVTFSAGSTAQGAQADPGQLRFTLDNNDGRFTALNPSSPYWPNVVRNVPVRVTVTWPNALSTYEVISEFIDGWPIQPNAGIVDIIAPIVSSGRLRRLELQDGPASSAVRRSVPAMNPVAYWSLENQDLSSAVTGQTRASMSGDGTWADVNSTFWGSDTLPILTGSHGFVGGITHTYNNTTGWTLDWNVFIPAAPAGSNTLTIMRSLTKDQTVNFPEVKVIVSASTITAQAYDFFGGASGFIESAFTTTPVNIFGQWIHYKLSTRTVAGSTDFNFQFWACNNPSVSTNGTTSSITSVIGGPSTISVPADMDLAGCGIGHFYLTDGYITNQADYATSGWNGELATDRMVRLSGENSLHANLVATGTLGIVSAVMGAQLPNTLPALMDEIRVADNGLFVDNANEGDFLYTSGAWRYNASTSFTLDYFQHQIGDDLAATYDDQTLVTSFTATRSNGGGSATYSDPTSIDEYNKGATVNVALDSQLDDYAGWQVHLGTYDAYRISQVTIDILGRNPELAGDILVNVLLPFRLPQRISLVNLPTPPFPPGATTFDCFIEGFSCVLDSVMWQYTLNLSPAQPWNVAVTDDATTGLVTSDSSTLVSNITSTQTTIGSTVPAVAWTTAGADFPFDLNVGGERMTAVDCDNGDSILAIDGTFENAQVAAWGAPSGGTFTDAIDHVFSGTHAAKLVTTGTPTQTFVRAPSSVTVPLDTYTASGWFFATGSTTNVQITIDWSNSSFVFLSSSSTTVTLAANTWTKISVQAIAPAGAVHGQCGPTLQSSPATGKTIWVDDFSFTHGLADQTFTVVRSVNDVVKAHTSGEPIEVWLPAIVAYG